MLLYKHIPLYFSPRGEVFCKDFCEYQAIFLQRFLWISSYQAIWSSFSESSIKNVKQSEFSIKLSDLSQSDSIWVWVWVSLLPKTHQACIKLRNHHSHRLLLPMNLDDYMLQQYVSCSLVILYAWSIRLFLIK